ncbi:uncharacterized protein PAC_01030 [Phialocephala subalpina]|uniref:Uncharacterized protein n=1 Tax=Phialocephala subalpina TaxID=576137 RepID=A0A1L7WEE8_9HELO|nr:uncharacterized protein PAC_01030 [Phialocephala subalpina]
MYIEKGIIRQPEAIANDLLEKLIDFGATDRYYAKERMQQPKDAIGMPQRILDLDRKNWIRSSRIEQEEEDFARRLRRQEEELANRQLLSQRQHLLVMEREDLGQQQSRHVLDSHLLGTDLRDREHRLGLSHQDEAYNHRLTEMAATHQMRQNMEAAQYENKFGMQERSRDAQLRHYEQTQDKKLNYLGEEQTMWYNNLIAQQDNDEIGYREKLSNVERAELDQKLQFVNQMNTGRIQTNRDLGDIEYAARQNKLQVKNQNRQAQLQYQTDSDRQKGKIELDTRAGLDQIETETMYEKIQMTQQDRGHKLATEHRMGQIQNQNLQDRYEITQQDRNNLLETETRMGQIQSHNLQKKVITQLEYLQATNREKLGYQQNFDHQKLQTLSSEGHIQNSTLQNRNQPNPEYQYQAVT